MLRKDFLVKQFEEFGKVLAALLTQKKAGNFEEFERGIDAALKKFTEKDLLAIESMPEETFKKEILQNEKLSHEQKKIMASVLFEKMKYYMECERTEASVNLHRKCLNLYKNIQLNSTENEFDLEVHYRLELLSKGTYHLPS